MKTSDELIDFVVNDMKSAPNPLELLIRHVKSFERNILSGKKEKTKSGGDKMLDMLFKEKSQTDLLTDYMGAGGCLETYLQNLSDNNPLNVAKTELIKQQSEALRVKNEKNKPVESGFVEKSDYQTPNCAVCRWKEKNKLKSPIVAPVEYYECSAQGGATLPGCYDNDNCRALFEAKENSREILRKIKELWEVRHENVPDHETININVVHQISQILG